MNFIFAIFLLNNLVWMAFVYVFIPFEKKRSLPLPQDFVPTPKKKPLIPPEMENLTSVTLEEVAKSMGMVKKK